MTSLIWLHEDALRMTHPVFTAAEHNYTAFCIWDNDYFKDMNYGFNRLSFIYEAMSDLPHNIYKGPIEKTILELAKEVNSQSLYVPFSPNHVIKQHLISLEKKLTIKVVKDEPFVDCNPTNIDKRFFRYWNKIKKYALQDDTKS